MPGKTKFVYCLALLLGAVLLGAQLHCCVDVNSRTMDSHFCPICSTAGMAVTTPSLVVAIIPAINWLPDPGGIVVPNVETHRNISPRAPPPA